MSRIKIEAKLYGIRLKGKSLSITENLKSYLKAI